MLKKIIFIVLLIIGTIVLFRNLNKWALSLQQTLISESKKLYNHTVGWEKTWRLLLLKVMIIFLGIVIMLMAFSFLFGTIYV